MGFDPEKQQFTADNYEMLPVQTLVLIREMEPGDVRYALCEDLIVDRSPERKVWVNGCGAAFTDTEVMQRGNSEPDAYFRIIKISEGYIADFSHLNIKNWRRFSNKYGRDSLPDDTAIELDESDPLPVIHCVFNQDELDVITPALEQVHNVTIKGFELQPLLDAIEDAEDVEGEELDEETVTDDEKDDDSGIDPTSGSDEPY